MALMAKNKQLDWVAVAHNATPALIDANAAIRTLTREMPSGKNVIIIHAATVEESTLALHGRS